MTSGYYLRLRVADVTGVLADITRILADKGISIDALLQKESEQVDANGKGETDIILITHETVEKEVNAAIKHDRGAVDRGLASHEAAHGRVELGFEMNYISTRGAGAGERHTFSDILLGGLAKDGGLYLPAEYPRVTADELTRWRTLPYADLAFEILSKFSDDIPAEDLRALTRRTYTAETYCNVRDHESAAQITPLKTLGVENGAPLSLLELSNGPTLAFKDMAMQLLGNLFEYALARARRRR